MEEQLKILKDEIQSSLEQTKGKDALEAIRIKYLGRKGKINSYFREIAKLPVEQRKIYGNRINIIKQELTQQLNVRLSTFKIKSRTDIDLLLPGKVPHTGHLHPLSKIFNELITFFTNFGFSVATGPEIEYDWYNFEALNMAKDHPARDMFSSFYIKEDLLLRSHTSPTQIRVMEKQKPPIKIICPGRCYRYDAFDASHAPVFHQIEALYVDEGVSFGELKWLLGELVKFLFGPKTKYELRPSFFPFTEPSGELAISCTICDGDGCAVCGNTGWLELGGCGMVHPQVLKNVKISPRKYSGYALGMGVDRIAMIKYIIDDIRVFFNNDIRFLEQF
ncbi:MAG: phenylalanine--tRNA ligase subunit alpha [Candidatus Stahlbacteria bacterium]|nr:MAG: phenylalanine--tRNA ligase subunit alpha [Candidatus Stahlbacteria bacterium]